MTSTTDGGFIHYVDTYPWKVMPTPSTTTTISGTWTYPPPTNPELEEARKIIETQRSLIEAQSAFIKQLMEAQ